MEMTNKNVPSIVNEPNFIFVSAELLSEDKLYTYVVENTALPLCKMCLLDHQLSIIILQINSPWC